MMHSSEVTSLLKREESLRVSCDQIVSIAAELAIPMKKFHWRSMMGPRDLLIFGKLPVIDHIPNMGLPYLYVALKGVTLSLYFYLSNTGVLGVESWILGFGHNMDYFPSEEYKKIFAEVQKLPEVQATRAQLQGEISQFISVPIQVGSMLNHLGMKVANGRGPGDKFLVSKNEIAVYRGRALATLELWKESIKALSDLEVLKSFSYPLGYSWVFGLTRGEESLQEIEILREWFLA